jgi:peroxiredoxin Q/BCP
MLNDGDLFPDFSLQDQNGTIHTQDEFRGSTTIIYFYPKDDTSGCTAEACGFRDNLPQFQGANVFGVSPDSPKSHAKFVEKFHLNFTLLADTEKKLCEAAGVWVEKSMYGKKYMGVERTTFLVGEDGRIRRIWRKVRPEGHSAEVLGALK